MAALPAWDEGTEYSYADAFKQFVLEDPEVVAFARQGIKSAPEYEAVFCKGRCTPYGAAEWPVDSERWATIGFVHPDPKQRSDFDCFAEPAPIEIALAAEALLRRYRALIGMLRQGKRDAYGVAESTGLVERIPRSIWQHEDFHISAQGDVFQTNHKCEDYPFDSLIRRWSAIELRAPGTARTTTTSTFHVQPTTFEGGPSFTSNYEISVPPHRKLRRRKTPKADLVAAALEAEGLTVRPVGLTYKEIAARIRPRLSGVNMTDEALAKTIGRYFNKKPSAR
jgi:hypothetical protein